MSERKVGPVAKFLLDGAKFFENEDRFVQGQFIARGGGFFKPRYCALGYISCHKVWRVNGDTRAAAEDLLHDAAYDLFELHSVMEVNDDLGRESVVKAFKHAAQLALNAQV